MNILLTGGANFIERQLCKHWLQRNEQLKKEKRMGSQHTIWVLDKKPEMVEQKCGKGVLGISNVAELDAQKIHIDTVINLMGEPTDEKPWTQERKKLLSASRLAFTNQLVAWMGRRSDRPHSLISGSSVAYYGDRGDDVLDDYINETKRDFYGQLCHHWEVEAFQALLSDIRVVCLRMGTILASHTGVLDRLLPRFRIGLGGPLGNGKQWISWIHAQDAVEMIDFFLNTWETAGSFNVCSPEPVTGKQFSVALGKVLHRPTLLGVSAGALERKYGKELGQSMLYSQRAIPKRAMEAGYQFRFPKLKNALEDLLLQKK